MPAADWAHLGPTRATSIVACIPAYMAESGQSVSAGSIAGRAGSFGAAGHLDADTIDLEQLEAQSREVRGGAWMTRDDYRRS